MTSPSSDSLSRKYACFHGHFYQPPRENPWLEEGEPEESASPYRDWNERILHECYGPNAACPVPDGFGRIRELRDNYRRISFNFGATLFSWLERHHPALYGLILEADRKSLSERGHGNAIAQPFVHAILPLQSLRDKTTMVRWGIADFVYRFARLPEGMWLPETGVDNETLEVLAAEGIRFTILAPHQAGRVRDIGASDSAWTAPGERNLNTSRPYRWNSPSKRDLSLSIFFYYAELHEDICHRAGIPDGETLARKVRARFNPDSSVQLVHTATDGEYFGHHRPRGHETLADALRWLESEGVAIVNYAQFLDLYPPPQEVEIAERTAWSCPHGIGRWSEDCGCKIQADRPSHQKWRRPMLDAMDRLKARIDEVYEKQGAALFRDPWAARDAYVTKLLEDSTSAAQEFLSHHSQRNLSPRDAQAAVKLCEMERHRLLMLTSCGWFFDDISGIEASQNLKSASRAIELALGFGADLMPDFKNRLAFALSNDARFLNGAGVLERLALPVRADLARAAAHGAILRHLDGGRPPRMPRRFAFSGGKPLRWDKPLLAGQDRSLTLGPVEVRDHVTLERLEAWTVVHQADRLDVACWVSPKAPPDDIETGFQESGDAELRHYLARTLGEAHHGIEAVFSSERASVLRVVMAAPARTTLRTYLERWRAAARGLGKPVGEDEVLELMSAAQGHGLHVEQLPDLDLVRRRLSEVIEAVEVRPDQASVSRLVRWVEVCEATGFHLSMWELNSFCWEWLRALSGRRDAPPFERDAASSLARKLNFSENLQEVLWQSKG
ncbi:MAG: DUF3536 domain-containing protein [Elusimicrobia bacterium]|nr:DUF3536 domain-containing protein [Elusimicrobiota bacterium]